MSLPCSAISSRRASAADALLALNAAHVQRGTVCRLAAELDLWRDAAAGELPELAARLGVPAGALARAHAAVAQADVLAAAERARCAMAGARVLTLLDADYPPPLRELALPPPVLYVRGTLPCGARAAIVGSRHPSAYGREAAWLFARDLGRQGVTVVSGFARGVDAAAHRGALAGGGTTVAVLGCGLDVPYPVEHHPQLAAEVAASGALVSELPLGRPPKRVQFPIRNRLIAALARVVLVVEAATRSGSLITARLALELGREVMALPGRIFDETAAGPNALLADGARPALHPRDLLAELGLREGDEPPPAGPTLLPGLGARLLDALPPGAVRGVDELAGRCAAPLDAVLAELLELELAGWVARLPGPAYCRR